MLCGLRSLTLVGLLVVPIAQAQRVSAASSGRIAAVSSTIGVGAAVKGNSAQSAGGNGFAFSEGAPKIAGGKVRGYGVKMGKEVLSEYASEPTAASLSSGTGRDFPITDFVGTMPGPVFPGDTSVAAGGSNFGLTLNSGTASGSNALSDLNAHHAVASPVPMPKMKDPDAILNPFTHPISVGLGKPVGTGLGSLR
jgi:hypothetical protein